MSNHTRFNGVFGEQITLYAYFYKEYNGEIRLTEPSSIGYVQIVSPEGTLDGDDIDILEDLTPYGYTGKAGIRGVDLSSIMPGIKKLSFIVPSTYDLNKQTQFEDNWYDIVAEDSSAMPDQENVFYVSPRSYDGEIIQPTTEVNLVLSVDKTEARKGEKEWLKFDITDENNKLTSIDEVKLGLYTEDREVVRSNIDGIPENLSVHHYLDTVNLQSYIDANYISPTESLTYPKTNTLISNELVGYNYSDSSRLLYVSRRGDAIEDYVLPSDISFDPARTIEEVYSCTMVSSSLSGYSSSDEEVTFHLKENDGSYVEYSLPENTFGITGEEVAEKFALYLDDQKDALPTADEIFYRFSSIGSTLAIIGTEDATSSLTIRNVMRPKYTTELNNDFSLIPNEIKIFEDSIVAGPTVVSAPLKYFSSLTYTYQTITETNNSTINRTTYTVIGTTVSAKSTIAEIIENIDVRDVRNSQIVTDNYISIQEDDEEFVTYILPYIEMGSSESAVAANIANDLISQATPLHNEDKIHYMFSADSSSLKLSCDNSVRKITLKNIENSAYHRLKGAFNVGQGETDTITIKGDIEEPSIITDSLTKFSSLTKYSVLNIAENEDDYIQYRLPANENNMTLGNLSNYLQDLREDYGTSLHYDFSTNVSGQLKVEGEAISCKKLKLKYDKPKVYAGDYLKWDFTVAEDSAKQFKASHLQKINSSDIAYTFASSLNQQRLTYGDSSLYFSNTAGKLILGTNDIADHFILLTASYVAPILESASLLNLSSVSPSNLMRIKENSDDYIDYTVYNDTNISGTAKASRLSSQLESQRGLSTTSTNYYFSHLDSKLRVVGEAYFTEKITLDNNNDYSMIWGQLGGDFTVGNDATKLIAESVLSFPSMANAKLGNDFNVNNSAVFYYNSTLSPDAVITETMPLSVDDAYKWVANVTINERVIILDTDFTFTEKII